MKRLSSFVAALFISSAALGSGQYCADIAGTWTVANSATGDGGTGNITLTLNQDSTKKISGTLSHVWCPISSSFVTLTVDSTVSKATGNGQFFVETDTVNSCTWDDTFTIPNPTAGCGSGTWDSTQSNAPMTINQCMLPSGNPQTGEQQSVPKGFSAGLEQYQAVLNNPSSSSSFYNYAGRVAYFNNATPSDTCYRAGYSPNILVYPDTFSELDSTNTDNDNIGFLSAANVGGIRTGQTSFPCSSTYTETVAMDCPSGLESVEIHTNVLTVNGPQYYGDTVTIQRNGASSNPQVFGAAGIQTMLGIVLAAMKGT